MRAYVGKIDGYTLAEKKYGKSYADYFYRVIGKRPELTRALEVVEIDHTVMDFFILDSVTHFPLGRPTFTIMLDVKTRTVREHFWCFLSKRLVFELVYFHCTLIRFYLLVSASFL